MTILMALMIALWVAPLPGPGGGRPAVESDQMVRVPAGSYLPHYSRDGKEVEVGGFLIDRYPVTRSDYAKFVEARPSWRRSALKPVFANSGYLAGWRSDLDYGGAAAANFPVTEVSWFAAKSYCEWRGKRLPSTDEWEYVGKASETRRDASKDPRFLQRLVELATEPRMGSRSIGSGFRNVYGIDDLHGVVWEWVRDFNNTLLSDDARATGSGHDRQLYCAAGGVQATNPSEYPAFLRYAVRAGLDARATVGTVGFRCARSL